MDDDAGSDAAGALAAGSERVAAAGVEQQQLANEPHRQDEIASEGSQHAAGDAGDAGDAGPEPPAEAAAAGEACATQEEEQEKEQQQQETGGNEPASSSSFAALLLAPSAAPGDDAVGDAGGSSGSAGEADAKGDNAATLPPPPATEASGEQLDVPPSGGGGGADNFASSAFAAAASTAAEDAAAAAAADAAASGVNAVGGGVDGDAPPQQQQHEQQHERAPDPAVFAPGRRALDVEVDLGPNAPCRLLHVLVDVTGGAAAAAGGRGGGGGKPFLGGFRHRGTGAVFHHAAVQAADADDAAAAGEEEGVAVAAAARQNEQQQQQHQQRRGRGQEKQQHKQQQKLCRETQTVRALSTSCQTLREAATQMARRDVALDESGDRLLTPRPYTTAAAVHARRCAAALTVQRWCRGWLARRRAAGLRAARAERDAFLSAAAAEQSEEAAEARRRELERRTHPLRRADFALLRRELEAWRKQQAAAIKAAGLSAEEEHEALQLLLAKETRLLQTLDRLRVNARDEARAARTHATLSGMASPQTWSLSNGRQVLVHTPATVRAAELQQLHRGLCLPGLPRAERLDVLMHARHAVTTAAAGLHVAGGRPQQVARELVQLLDREADLLGRGRDPSSMEGLRRRIAAAFLDLCRDAAFNPAAAALAVLPCAGPGGGGVSAYEYVAEDAGVGGDDGVAAAAGGGGGAAAAAAVAAC